MGVLCLGACGGDEDDAADTSAASTTARRGEPIVIRSTLIVAAEEGSEPIATGTILEGSTLGGTPFCAGGTILESHASLDPKMKAYLIDRKITCPDGTVRIGYTPEVGADPLRRVRPRRRVSGRSSAAPENSKGWAEAGKARPCMAQTPVRRFAPRLPEPSRDRDTLTVPTADGRRVPGARRLPIKDA